MAGIGVALGIASLGVGVAGAMNAKKSAKKAEKQNQTMIDAQMQRQKDFDAVGKPMLQAGQQGVETVAQYLQRLASGDRNTVGEAVAPELNAMTQAQQGSVAASRSMYPRGGSAAAASQAPYALQGQQNNLLFQARQAGIAGLGNLRQNQVSQGLSAMGQGAGLTNSLLQFGLDARRQQFAEGQAIGQGIGGSLDFAQQMFSNANSRQQPLNAQGSGYSGPGLFHSYSSPSGGGFGSLGGGSTPNTSSYNTYSPPSNPFSGGSFLSGRSS